MSTNVRQSLARDAFYGNHAALYDLIRAKNGYSMDGNQYPANSLSLEDAIRTVEALSDDEILPYLPSTKLVKDARSLSSGTIGSLIHKTDYESIDEIQRRFIAFCQRYSDKFETWVEAWHEFEIYSAEA